MVYNADRVAGGVDTWSARSYILYHCCPPLLPLLSAPAHAHAKSCGDGHSYMSLCTFWFSRYSYQYCQYWDPDEEAYSGICQYCVSSSYCWYLPFGRRRARVTSTTTRRAERKPLTSRRGRCGNARSASQADSPHSVLYLSVCLLL